MCVLYVQKILRLETIVAVIIIVTIRSTSSSICSKASHPSFQRLGPALGVSPEPRRPQHYICRGEKRNRPNSGTQNSPQIRKVNEEI